MGGGAVAECAILDFDEMLESNGAPAIRRRRCESNSLRKGTANAARVSRGTEFDVWRGLSVKSPERNASEHVTITVVIYNTVAGGVPTEEDVISAIDDLETLYATCGANGQLADGTFDFMKQDLTVQDTINITTKVVTQPYNAPSVAVINHDVFPVCQA